MESEELRIRSRISDEWTRRDLEAMERDARYAFFYTNHQFQLEVREYQRQARDAVSQAVQEPFESYESYDHAKISRYPESV